MKIQVFEHQKLKYTEEAIFSKSHFEALLKFNEKNKHKYFEVISKGVKFKQFVGVIQVGKLTIEILPKADQQNTLEEDRFLWQKILLEMLKVSQKIKIHSANEAFLKPKNASILDIYAEFFLLELKQTLQQGLIKQYKQQDTNSKVLKGRVHFAQNLQKNLGNKTRFYTRQIVYEKNNLLNQILRKTLDVLSTNIYNARIRQKVEELRLQFPEMSSDFLPKPETFEKIKLQAKTQHYQTALKIAEMILLNFSPDLQAGKENVLALLFDMNKLFESYIFKILQKEVEGSSWQITKQQSRLFWENQRIRPDIILKNLHTNQCFIIDTKWKVLQSFRPNEADLKQMYVYHQYFEASKTFLLYPRTVQKESLYEGNFRANTQHINLPCSLIFVSDLLSKNLGKDIMSYFV